MIFKKHKNIKKVFRLDKHLLSIFPNLATINTIRTYQNRKGFSYRYSVYDTRYKITGCLYVKCYSTKIIIYNKNEKLNRRYDIQKK